MTSAGMYDDEDYDVLYEDELEDASDAPVSSADGGAITPEEAFIYSMNFFGRIDMAYMQGVTGMSSQEVIRALEGRLMWRDPKRYDPSSPDTCWVSKEQYVRGNIYRLLDEASYAQKKTGLFASNIALLRSVLPEGADADQISVTLGASWIPEDVCLDFICELLDMNRYQPQVTFDPFFGKWHIRGGFSYNRALNEHVYGTGRMKALHIIEHMMNATPIRICDKQYDPAAGRDKDVFNARETMAARERQTRIADAFQKWLRANPLVMERLQEIYTDRYGYQITHFDGSFLALHDMNPAIELYTHQRNAIARIILSPDNVLLSHSVGSGKTYEFEAGVYERIKMGLSRKAMIVVPNAVLRETVDAFGRLYPGAQIIAYFPKDFTPARREDVIRSMEDASSGIFIMAYSSFDMLGMSGEWHKAQYEREIRRVNVALSATIDYARAQSLRRYADHIKKEYADYRRDHKDTATECFDRLDIDLMVVDECHNYKNISLNYNMDPIVGMHAKGSKKADLMLDKCDCVRQAGGKLVFATGTPLTNSLADLFVLQRYLQPKELELLGISHFNEWVNTFCSRWTDFEIDVSASSYRFVTRFDRFHNLPELMALFGNVCDFYTADTDELGLPDFSGYENVQVKRSDAQAAYIRQIAERTENIRKRRVSPSEDNYLKVTTDGRKCALDIRLVEDDLKQDAASAKGNGAAGMSSGTPSAADETPSKIDVACANIWRLYCQYPSTTQVVFCDISTPRNGFNVYDAMRERLVALGIPAGEVRFIHEGASESGRARILADFNAGRIRILIGSTAKLGIGVNIQRKLLAIHHLDAPWKPSDMVQREGRGIRQGNENAFVFVYRYVTESSFDAYTWQILENKQKFIASFLSGTMDRMHRSEEDIGDLTLDYAEIKALAIGNPLIRTRVEIANRITRERARSFERQASLRSFRNIVDHTARRTSAIEERLGEVDADIRIASRQDGGKMGRKGRQRYGEKLLRELKAHTFVGKDRIYGSYRAFTVILPGALRIDAEHPYILLRGSGKLSYKVDMKDAKPLGVTTRMDNVLAGLQDVDERLRAELDGVRRQCADAAEELAAGNPHEQVLLELKKQLEEVDQKLKAGAA